MALSKVRKRLQTLRSSSTAPYLKTFVPEGSLSNVFQTDELIYALDEDVFNIPTHKRETTARIICGEASKVFAILLELHWEQLLWRFIENDVLDSRLPLDEATLRHLIPEPVKSFECLQYEYLAYRFRSGQYHKKLSDHQILPYIHQECIGGGGFSTVYKVRVHSSHQNLIDKASPDGIDLIRKELKPFHQDEQAEAELLFLLRSLRHPNIVELLASYTQHHISNLLFYPADMDLDDFLLQRNRPTGFTDAFSFHQAMHGLSDGLSYLHNFRPRPSSSKMSSEVSMHGYHHDIKPRNVLVRGTDFILADFGTSKMKELDEDSQTPWKNTTFEYGAPECRDPESLAAGVVGQPLDIWSLACIFTEIVTYAEQGSQGLEDFRRRRLRDNLYGQLRCFHDDERLDQIVRTHLDDLEEKTPDSSTRKVLSIILKMFATKPADRIHADDVEKNLACAAIEALLDALLGRIQNIIDAAGEATDQNLYTTRLKIEMNHLLGWAGALGIKKILKCSKPFDEQALVSFFDSCGTLRTAIAVLDNEVGFDDVDDTHDFVLCQLQQTNNHLCKGLTREIRMSVDQMFGIITANTRETLLLQDVDWLGLVSSVKYDDAGIRTAIKYMTLLLEKQGKERVTSHRIEALLVKKDDAKFDLFARPQIQSYSYGYGPGEERKVIVETMPYWQKQHGSNSEEFQRAIEAMFSRVQDLVEILQVRPMPLELRILECLGTFHDPQQAGFKLVYGFPSEDTVPIRLNKLLRHRKTYEIYPDLSQKLVLAKALVACIQSLHMFGWIHKTFSSLNVLFFHNPAYDLADLDFGKPYVVGLDHSRRDRNGEYSCGPINSTNPGSNAEFVEACREYLHPDYRLGSTTTCGLSPFVMAYDYYALGLLLLEIGTWTSLSNIYDSSRLQNHNPRALRHEYIRYCDEHLGKAMGPIFQSITKRCLEYDAVDIDQVSGQLMFQAEVVDQLNRCVF